MSVFVVIMGASLAIIIHELGHLFAMKKCGVEVEEICFGFFPSIFPSITFPARFIGENTSITISLFILGGYVWPSESGKLTLEVLPYKDRAVIYGSGIIWNLIIGFAVFAFYDFWFSQDWLHAIHLLLIGYLIFLLRKELCRYFFPIFGPLVLMVTAWAIFFLLPLSSQGGPVLMVQEASRMNVAEAFKFVASLSLGLGLANMFPLVFFDGGRIMLDLIRKFYPKLENAYGTITIIIAAISIAWPIALDVIRLLF
ncbi:MAG: hypothetical protein COT26_02565 [Candidatus Kerfeldbacteria bacterium CG08_land_8_20_14_0_20_43_14]|uniref:Peptidase M50 domain-containing protein n=1 Tax=Candidatus Kerfeldbacteria bacterium CG08_land_8_20_14_0_20_43_14 TaxID=2014246 RepID=A0A2H0YQ52_9BACT|nr:MAG: hypothetical protein COT26_02565 [Candidatus Kerfeldbacteria bacterium CG08_land_8_20_14_0_20_43_14]